MNETPIRLGFYARCVKRILDIICALVGLILLGWLILLLWVLVRIKIGAPAFFIQPRPGKVRRDGKERIFRLYKFRSMTDACDANGKLLPDGDRLTSFGARLRNTSLDELPQLWNILRGDMSVIGPRPLLVRDMTFMTDAQRKRHLVRPGLTGYAQVNGRNAIAWEDKLEADLVYLRNVTFKNDIKILVNTVLVVLKKKDINQRDTATTDDFGDALLKNGKISQAEYDAKQDEALRILDAWQGRV